MLHTDRFVLLNRVKQGKTTEAQCFELLVLFQLDSTYVITVKIRKTRADIFTDSLNQKRQLI